MRSREVIRYLLHNAVMHLNPNDPINIALPLIKHFEQFYPEMYLCPAGKPTIGYGHVILPGEDFGIITEPEASKLLKQELVLDYYPRTKRAVRKRGIDLQILKPYQRAAILSFTYNCGVGAVSGPAEASWPDKFRAGDMDGARLSWLAWNKGGGMVLAGLVRRRFAEWQLFMTGEWGEQPEGWREYYQAVK